LKAYLRRSRNAEPGLWVRHGGVLIRESVVNFIHNGDLRKASSLAFYTTLALLPALLLLTYMLSLAIGSSQAAVQSTFDLVQEMLPSAGDAVLKEVSVLSRHPRSASLINLLVLTWSLTPLVSSLREVINGIFKVRNRRSIWMSKALDLISGLLFITGLAAVAGLGLLLNFLARGPLTIPTSLKFPLPFAITVLLVFGMYGAYTPKVRPLHLLAGALTTALLWFLLRPAFTLFLTWDQGYGFTFGSFKSIFIVVIWIYYSLAVLLFGAEVTASLHRGDTQLSKRLVEGKRHLTRLGHKRFLVEAAPGHVFFREGTPGEAMYHILKGTVSLRAQGAELARLGEGQFFGEMTFLLGQDRSATAVAMQPCECVIVHRHNFDALLLEYPGTVRAMLVEMAQRLQRPDPGQKPLPSPDFAPTFGHSPKASNPGTSGDLPSTWN
jgi:membrane protein